MYAVFEIIGNVIFGLKSVTMLGRIFEEAVEPTKVMLLLFANVCDCCCGSDAAFAKIWLEVATSNVIARIVVSKNLKGNAVTIIV